MHNYFIRNGQAREGREKKDLCRLETKSSTDASIHCGCSVSNVYFVIYNNNNLGKVEEVELLTYKAQGLFRYRASCRVISLRKILALELRRI